MYKKFSLTQSLIFTEVHRTFPQGCGPQCVQLCRVPLRGRRIHRPCRACHHEAYDWRSKFLLSSYLGNRREEMNVRCKCSAQVLGTPNGMFGAKQNVRHSEEMC